MRRIFEARDVEHEREIASRVIAADRGEMSRARLSERAPRVARDDDRLERRPRRGTDVRSQPIEPCGMTLDACVGAVAARETRDLVDGEAAFAHALERRAAIEQLFAEPAPRSFPQAARID